MNKEKVLKIVQIALPVLSLVVAAGTDYFKNKELDEKISKKVTEALANAKTEES